MTKDQRGVTLLILTITIIVLIIIASITSNVGVNMIRKANYYKAVSELKAMQVKVNELYEEYKLDNTKVFGKEITASMKSKCGDDYNYVQDNLRTDIIDSQGHPLSSMLDVGNFNDYRLFDVDYIKNDLKMDGIDLDFIVNIKTRTVILVNGVNDIENKNKKYYSLYEIEDEMYNVKYNEE